MTFLSGVPVEGASSIKNIAKLYNDKTSSDVTFVVGKNETEFFGHTLIIGAASQVFHAQFSGDWKDNRNVKLENVQEGAFEALMLYIYKDEIKVEKRDLLDSLELAHRYMMIGLLKSLTTGPFFKTYCYGNIWQYLTFADTIDDFELICRCLDMIINYAKPSSPYEEYNFVEYANRKDVILGPEFLEIKSSIIVLILKQDTLPFEEFELFEMMLKWSSAECQRQALQVSPSNQRKVMQSFIHRIRFPIMTLEQITSVGETGVLTASELNQVKYGITNNKRRMTPFDWEKRRNSAVVYRHSNNVKYCFECASRSFGGFFYSGECDKKDAPFCKFLNQ